MDSVEREYTKEEAYVLDIDEPPVNITLTKEEETLAIIEHNRHFLSITSFCQLLNCSRDRYYSVVAKAGIKAGTVDYKLLAREISERRQHAERVRREIAERASRKRAIATPPDEEW